VIRKPEGKRPLERFGKDVRTILRWILRKQGI
jgi:hypothetical protein